MGGSRDPCGARRVHLGAAADEQELAEMGNYNEQLVKAGVMVSGEGLHPSSKGKQVKFSGGERTVVHGPFPITGNLLAGFWMWQVSSMEEAEEWVRRMPNPLHTEATVEIRPVFEGEDFGAEFTPELQEQEAPLRAQIEGYTNK